MLFNAIYPQNSNPIYEVEDFEAFLAEKCNFDKSDITTVSDMYDNYLQASEMRAMVSDIENELYTMREYYNSLCLDVLDELDVLKEYTFEKTLSAAKKDKMREDINRIMKMIDDSF